MRTTVRIDDDLMPQLRNRAEKTGESITQTFNKLLRRGLSAEASDSQQEQERFVQQTYNMGKPLIDINKALAISLEMDDIERMQKLDRPQRNRQQDEADRH